ERSRRILERLEYAAEIWDESKHPRAGGPPNAGWFASTGGSAGIAPLAANRSPGIAALQNALPECKISH
ncbi:MAG TPA: hypothetical protein VG433_08500, partial [Pirellulales bacterium]|nr:hypothetical protein [Pirellulales bacterium]